MKKHRRKRTKVMGRAVAGLIIVAALLGCGGGGGGGGSSSNQNQSSNWDTMVWDQGNWR